MLACLHAFLNIREEYYRRNVLARDGELNSFSGVKSRICRSNEPTSILTPSSVDATNRTRPYIQDSDIRCLGKVETLTKLYIKLQSPIMCLNLEIRPCVKREPGSSVGIATDYGLDGPGSNSCGDEIFRPFGPALGPTQPPVKWIPGLSRG